MNKHAVTILEILVVLIIIGILAAVATPLIGDKIKRIKGERAIANIEMIVDAWKMYYIKNDSYYFVNSGGFNDFTFSYIHTDYLSEINNSLGLEISDGNFFYDIFRDTGHPPCIWDRYYFIATARQESNPIPSSPGVMIMYVIEFVNSYGAPVNPPREGWVSPFGPIGNGYYSWPWMPTSPVFGSFGYT